MGLKMISKFLFALTFVTHIVLGEQPDTNVYHIGDTALVRCPSDRVMHNFDQLTSISFYKNAKQIHR